jgi:hypothetical protein
MENGYGWIGKKAEAYMGRINFFVNVDKLAGSI